MMNSLFRLNSILIAFITVITSISSVNAQIIAEKTIHDFGEVGVKDKKYVDFKLTNASQNAIRINKFETPYGVSILFSDKIIDPDESILVRIKYTPKRKGPFRADVSIFVSSNNQPIILTIMGKAMSFDLDESLVVPEFEEITEEKTEETFTLDIKVIKRDDKSPVENAKLDIIWDGVMYKNYTSNGAGVVNSKFVPDKYYIVVHAEDLGTFESELSIHKNVKEFIIELGPEGTISQVTEDSADVYETEIIEEAEAPPIEEVVTEETIIKDENQEFSDNEFRPNNIVFLIDVSVSMKQKGKMNLLKASMIELTDLLRPIDKVAIVTYSSKAELALKSTSASNKEEIKKVIQSLEPKGSTAGQRGIKKAYQVLAENEIKNGNNQVFISTDGAFNLEKQDKALIDIARKNAKKGYKISVIGIKNEKWTVKNMKKLAEEGNGNYLHITTYSDAKTKLVDEVKTQSKQKP